MDSYNDLIRLIDINKNILEQCELSLKEIEEYLINQGAPKGYSKGTSYLDADCIKGSREELHADALQKLIEEAERLRSMIYLQQERLKRLLSTKENIDNKLKGLEGWSIRLPILSM